MGHEENTHTKKKANIHFAQPCALPSACSGCLHKPWATWHAVLAPSTRVAQGNSKIHQLSHRSNPKQSNTSTTHFPPYVGIKQVCRKDLQKLNTDIDLSLKKKKSQKKGEISKHFHLDSYLCCCGFWAAEVQIPPSNQYSGQDFTPLKLCGLLSSRPAARMH